MSGVLVSQVVVEPPGRNRKLELIFNSTDEEFGGPGSPAVTVPVIDLRLIPEEIDEKGTGRIWERLKDPQVVNDDQVSTVVRTLRSTGKQVLVLQTGLQAGYVLYTRDT